MGFTTQEDDATLGMVQMLGGDMRRDDDLIRSILIEMQDDPQPFKVYGISMNPTPEQVRVFFHVMLLVDAGLLAPLDGAGPKRLYRITNAGHDFLAAVRDDTIWAKMKDAAAASGGAGLGILRELGVGYIKAKLAGLGFPVE